ncbi:hypothetical protein [Proteocatella sphenisci]|uniref:hypothetical protein n=1 Tax=Proteocatella sphenisci TaxID=181070 RepID=UPI00048AFE51|nr:hypothetical protein [Proteocatella sphenisci]
MNDNLIQKIEYPGESEIYGYRDFNSELMSIVKKSGKQKEIALGIRKYYDMLGKMSLQELIRNKHFEKLKDTKHDLYCIRFLKQLNLRIIFIFMEDDGRKVLIHAFSEKNKSDYKIAIKKSEGIVERLQGGK